MSRMLTAEQVREAIERHFGKVAVLDDGKPVEWRDDWMCKVAIDYRAIADELNSRAERTCKMETDHAELEAIASSHEDTWAYKCNACDWSFRYDRGIKPNYCPNCGAKVVEQ